MPLFTFIGNIFCDIISINFLNFFFIVVFVIIKSHILSYFKFVLFFTKSIYITSYVIFVSLYEGDPVEAIKAAAMDLSDYFGNVKQ